MKIKLKKEGGFMGMCSNADVEMDKLSDSEREILADMVTNLPQKKEVKKPDDKPESETPATSTLKPENEAPATSILKPEGEVPATPKAEGETPTTLPPPDDIVVEDRAMYMRDSTSYEVKVKKGSRYVTFKFDDKSIPQKVYDLFQKYT